MNASSFKSNKTWQTAPTASANMRSTTGLNIGVFNFGDLGQSGGIATIREWHHCGGEKQEEIYEPRW